MTKPTTSLQVSSASFNAFNARFIKPSDVARTFVPPAQFEQLIEPSHSVVSGPRGSGKTTLLKMLTLEALSAWRHPRRDETLRKINYTSIFVGADILWTGQLDAIAGGDVPAEVLSQVQEALFRLHVCFSALDAFSTCERLSSNENRLLSRFGIAMAEEEAAELVRELACAWGVAPVVDSFRALRSALRAEVGRMEQYVKALRRGEGCSAPGSLGITWLSAITAFVGLVNEAIGDRDRQWALLVDELEITRPQLRDEVFASLRSTDRRLIFKLALFPYQTDARAGELVAAPTPANDYQPIVLWYSGKEQGYGFCEDLLKMLVREEDGGKAFQGKPEDIFGPSRFDGGREANRKSRLENRSVYAVGGSVYDEFKWLTENDPSFANFILRRNIDLDTMDELSEHERAAKIRKLLPITTVRRWFRRELASADQRQQRVRSTHRLDLYTGAYSIFALSEGNPRVFINLAKPIVSQYVSDGKKRFVPRDQQVRHIYAVLERFRAYVAGTPYARATSTGASVWDFVDTIGSYFEQRVLFDDFSADAPLQFEADADLSPVVKELLGRAVNLGLVVPMTGGKKDAVMRDLSKEKFRLAFTICPYFRLPLATTGTSVLVSSIMRWGGKGIQIEPNRFRSRASELADQQLSLPMYKS